MKELGSEHDLILKQSSMWASGVYSDVDIIVGLSEKALIRFHAHACILATASNYFNRKLQMNAINSVTNNSMETKDNFSKDVSNHKTIIQLSHQIDAQHFREVVYSNSKIYYY